MQAPLTIPVPSSERVGAEGDLDRAALMLQQRGYRLVVPPDCDSIRLRSSHRRRKKSVWAEAGRALTLDLHTGLADITS